MQQVKQTFIIGDVHAEYKTLLALLQKLPKNANIIFVGDLIDRGVNSAEVIALVREKGYDVVLGNHEDMMIHYGKSFLKGYPNTTNPSFLHTWYNNGGDATLFSYNLLKYDKKEGLVCVENKEQLLRFQDDIAWLESLPLYKKLPYKINNKQVVISHASCADVWHHHNNPKGFETFREYALWNRKDPSPQSEIYNIFGHSPVEFGIEIQEHFANVDTGCYLKRYGYNQLSAFCVETQEVVSVSTQV